MPMNLLINRLSTASLSFLQFFLPDAKQISFAGQGSARKLCEHVTRLGNKKVLLVTDKILMDLGVGDVVLNTIKEQGGEVVVYDGVLPDPTVSMVEQALKLQKQHACQAVIAMGGGSSIDTAKAVSAAASNGDIRKLLGILKVKQAPIPLFAIPTTSGTGSEVSLAAVISDDQTHEKTVMADPKIVPKAVALDPELLVGMPPSVTASTAMDALSHALETYLSRWTNNSVQEYSGAAVKMIFQWLPTAYQDGKNLQARESLSLASYYAGLSLNDASVGNVHALAHQIGGKYGIPHGVAISAVMPHVLTFSKAAIVKPLARLADLIGVTAAGDSEALKADKFIEALLELQKSVSMPATLEKIQASDVDELAKQAVKEAWLYPVPKVMGKAEAKQMINAVRG